MMLSVFTSSTYFWSLNIIKHIYDHLNGYYNPCIYIHLVNDVLYILALGDTRACMNYVSNGVHIKIEPK